MTHCCVLGLAATASSGKEAQAIRLCGRRVSDSESGASGCGLCACRHHRYIFEEKKQPKNGQPGPPVGARLQELGPRFTLKLRSLQVGIPLTRHTLRTMSFLACVSGVYACSSIGAGACKLKTERYAQVRWKAFY